MSSPRSRSLGERQSELPLIELVVGGGPWLTSYAERRWPNDYDFHNPHRISVDTNLLRFVAKSYPGYVEGLLLSIEMSFKQQQKQTNKTSLSLCCPVYSSSFMV